MIVSIDSHFAESQPRQKLSDECSLIMQYGHYIRCDRNTRLLICGAIKECGSKSQRDMMLTYKGFDVTQELRRYLTTVELAAHADNLHKLIVMPSEVLTENSPYEWNLYKSLPEVYKHDAAYKNMYTLLSKAMKRSRIVPLHGGGFSQYSLLMQQKNDSTYKDVYPLKCCAIFDRDTENEKELPTRKNNLFMFLCGKDSTQLTMQDVYTLPTDGQWIWHMWYKRAVENYFPKEKYEELGVNVDKAPDSSIGYDYFKIDKDKVPGYKKNMVSELAKRMSRADFEKNARHFNVNGTDMSEIQLLLLKLVKLI